VSDRPVHVGSCADAYASGFFSLLYLAQMLARMKDRPVDLLVISQDTHEVTGAESIDPVNATILGPCRVIPQELSHVTCRHIDVSAHRDPLWMEQILAELSHFTEPQVALRGGFRWLPAVEKITADAPATDLPVREGGVYLITGGLGGIGLEIATFLARTKGVALALIARKGLPPRTHWEQQIANLDSSDSAKLASRIRGVQKLEEAGAEVLVIAADCSDPREMQEAVERVHLRFGRIHGVVHAAGLPGAGLIELKTPAAARRVLAPKLHGTLILDNLLNKSDLDFFVLCSSLSAMMGGIGQVDYCAANAFLDAFAQSRRRKPGRTVSINWDTWKDVGMAADAERALRQMPRTASMIDGISPQEGIETLSRILTMAPCPRVAISTSDLGVRMTQPIHPPSNDSAPPSARFQRPALDRHYQAPRNRMEESIAAIWQEVLGIDNIGMHDDFSELGGHSLMATQVLSRIRRLFRVDLPLRTLFEAPTIAQLAAIVVKRSTSVGDRNSLEEYLSRLENLSEDEAERELNEMPEVVPPPGEHA
jgi:NAD(P)-dependent dehydrogenase (short-subunit alcohol dehydrogenase family)/acyl carrier protein